MSDPADTNQVESIPIQTSNQPQSLAPDDMPVLQQDGSTSSGIRTVGIENDSMSQFKSHEQTIVNRMYDGMSALPRKEYVKKLANLATIIENIEEPYLHLVKLEELLNEYLATPRIQGPPQDLSLPITQLPSLIGNNPEFTVYFLDNALPTIVRNLLVRSFSTINMRTHAIEDNAAETIIPHVNQFFQLVMRVIVKHLTEPLKPVMMTLPMQQPQSPPNGPAGSSTSAPADASAPEQPAWVTQPVGPLFPDSISTNLLTTLQRLFDRERQYYFFYDRKGKGPSDDSESDSDDDDEFEAKLNAKLSKLNPDIVFRTHGLTIEQYGQSMIAAKRAKQEQKKQIEAMRPPVRYSAASPGMGAYGWLQRNIQFFGEIGGFELITQRLSSGINARLDSRVPVSLRRGWNSAQNARIPFYRKELARRVSYAKLSAARGDSPPYSAEPPVPPRGAFPSIAPYLIPEVFLDPGTSPPQLPPIPLHKVRLLMDPILKIWNLLYSPFFIEIGSRIKDTLIVRLLHIKPEEGRLCDKDYLQNVLQDYLWKFIKNLSVTHTGDWKQISWPLLDRASEIAWREDKKILARIQAANKVASESGESKSADGDELKDDGSKVDVEEDAVLVAEEIPPPPVLYELNLNADECMEAITIYLSYQLFCSPLLEKRINGLSDINRMVDLTLTRQRLDHPPPNAPKDPPGVRIPVTAWLDMEVLSNYLLQINIMDELFGCLDERAKNGSNIDVNSLSQEKSTHPQLLQRCDEIIRYLARLGKLTSNNLRQVWIASIGKHETIVQAIYHLLAQCVRCFSIEHIDQILNEFIPSIPLSEWTDHTVRLVQSCMDGGQEVSEELQIVQTGVLLLWKVMILPAELPPAEISEFSIFPLVAPPATTKLFKAADFVPGTTVSFHLKQRVAQLISLLLAKPALEPLRKVYILNMIGKLRSTSNPAGKGMFLWLLPCLLFAYTNARPQPEELQRWKVLSILLDKEKLYTVLLEDLARYTSAARTSFDALKDGLLKKSGKRKLPDAIAFVLPSEQPALGVGLSDLDASIALPSSLDSSVELLNSLKELREPLDPATGIPSSQSFSYELEVILRLEQLRHVVMHSFQVLNSKHVDQLWHGAFSQSVSDLARAQAFRWLRILHSPKSVNTPVTIAEAHAKNVLDLAAAAGTNHYVMSYSDPTRYLKGLNDEATMHLFQTHLSNPSIEGIAKLDESAFQCWRHYFLVLNEAQKLVRLHAPLSTVLLGSNSVSASNASAPLKFYVLPSGTPLIGLEHLWTICLHATNPNVVSMSVDLLIQAHACTPPPIVGGETQVPLTLAEADWLAGLKEKYVARCMEFMQSGDASNDAAHSAKLLRCLSLLHAFMHACAEPEDAPHEIQGESAASGAPFSIEVHVGAFVPNPNEVIRIVVNGGQTVRQVKEELSSLLSIPPSKMSLNHSGKELLNFELVQPSQSVGHFIAKAPTNRSNIQHPENDRPMEEDETEEALSLSRTFTPATGSSVGTETPLPETPATGSAEVNFPSSSSGTVTSHVEKRNPIQLLSTKYFDLLFSLLSTPKAASAESSTSSQLSAASAAVNVEISQRVWKLITTLPTNQKLLDEMKSLASVAKGIREPTVENPWSTLLDPNSPFKLLYSLRIVSKLCASHLSLATATAPSKSFIQAVEWRTKFMKLGGVTHLYQTMMHLLEVRSAAYQANKIPSSTAIQFDWDDARNACLALLLKLFNFFLLCSIAINNPAVAYLVPEVMPELTQLIPSASQQHQQKPEADDEDDMGQSHPILCGVLRSLGFGSAQGFVGSPEALTREAMKLLSDCAKSAAKTLKAQLAGAGGHTRTSSVSRPPKKQDTTENNLDEFLIKQATILLSTCVLQAPDESQPSGTTPLSLFTSSASSSMYSTLLFLCPTNIAHESSEAWLKLAGHFQSFSCHAPPLTIHRFIFHDVLLKFLPTLVSSARYAHVAQDFFQLIDMLVRDLLDHERDAAESGGTKILPGFDWQAFFLRLVGYMRSRPIHESKQVPSAGSQSSSKHSKLPDESSDEVLIGLMNLISTLLNKIPPLKDLVAERPRAHSLELEELLHEATIDVTGSNAHANQNENNVAAGLVFEVFSYLFDLPTLATAHLPIQAPKAKRKLTRLSAFNLLLTMVENHPVNFFVLSGLLYKQNVENNSVSTSSEWDYSPEDYTKSACGYVGLQNLGSTCYLNSMMQQLYMIPEFRKKVLAIPIPNLSAPGANTSGTSGSAVTSPVLERKCSTAPAGSVDPSDHLLYQVQFMFGFLEASSKKAYNTINFCKAMKDYEGKSIDIRIQQDIDEFFNTFCDRLEQSLKANHEASQEVNKNGISHLSLPPSSPSEIDLVKSVFGGELEHQLLCTCGHTSFRSEPFFALPLNVKGKQSIQASLENFICGEMLEGDNAYMCHSCVPPRKVKTFKRVCVKRLPQTLVLNLKRFEFDYNEMRKLKLNDLVAFPTEAGGLNMDPFTSEGLARKEAATKTAPVVSNCTSSGANDEESKTSDADALPVDGAPTLQTASSIHINLAANGTGTGESATYSLVGVLLHSGGSESGHYTSLVQERIPGSGGRKRWLHFNDSNCEEFDPSLLPEECFGGTKTVSVWDVKLRRKVTKEVDKTRSAYLLIYERDPPPTNKSTDTPLTSPTRQHGSGATKIPFSPPTLHSPDSPKASESGLHSPIRFSASSPAQFHTARAKTPSSDLRRSPSNSPPPLAMARGSSRGKKLEFADGDERDDLETDTMPTHSPSFSRQPSSTYESKVPELCLSPSSHRGSLHGSSSIMPPQIYETIWTENASFLRNSQLFQLDYFKFIVAFLQLAPPPQSGGASGVSEENMVDPTDLRTRRLEYGLPSELGCEEEIRHIQLASIFLTDVLAHAKFITSPATYERDRDRSEDEAARNGGGRTAAEQRKRMAMDGVTAPHALLPTYKALLLHFFSNHVPAGCWFLKDHLLGIRYRLRYFLFDCTSEFMRDYLADVFGLVISTLVNVERPIYEKMIPHEVKATGGTNGVQTVQTIYTPAAYVLQVIDHLISMFKDLAFNWKSLAPYFSILHMFASLGYNERMYLISTHSIIVAIIDLLLGNASPLAVHDKYKRPLLGDSETPPNFFVMYALLSIAVRSTLMDTSPENPERELPPTLLTIADGMIPLPVGAPPSSQSGLPSIDPAPAVDANSDTLPGSSTRTASGSRRASETPVSSLVLFQPEEESSVEDILFHTHSLTADEVDLLFNDAFLKKMMKEGANPEANKEILIHLCYDEDKADAYVCKHFLKLVEDANYDRLDPLFALMPAILQINDTLTPVRTERYLNPKTGIISKAVYFRSQYPLFTYCLLKFIFLTLGKMEGPVQDFLLHHRDSLYWGLNWIQIHHERQLSKPLLSGRFNDPESRGSSTLPPSSPAELKRVQSSFDTVTTIADWFGEEYLAAKAEQERIAAAAAAAAPPQSRTTLRDASALHARTFAPDDSDDSEAGDMDLNDDPDSREFQPDSDGEDGRVHSYTDADWREEDQEITELLAQPNGEALVLAQADRFVHSHPRVEQLKLRLQGIALGSGRLGQPPPKVSHPSRAIELLADTDGEDDGTVVHDGDESDATDVDVDDDVSHGVGVPEPLVHEPDDNYFDEDDPVEAVRKFELLQAQLQQSQQGGAK